MAITTADNVGSFHVPPDVWRPTRLSLTVSRDSQGDKTATVSQGYLSANGWYVEETQGAATDPTVLIPMVFGSLYKIFIHARVTGGTASAAVFHNGAQVSSTATFSNTSWNLVEIDDVVMEVGCRDFYTPATATFSTDYAIYVWGATARIDFLLLYNRALLSECEDVYDTGNGNLSIEADSLGHSGQVVKDVNGGASTKVLDWIPNVADSYALHVATRTPDGTDGATGSWLTNTVASVTSLWKKDGASHNTSPTPIGPYRMYALSDIYGAAVAYDNSTDAGLAFNGSTNHSEFFADGQTNGGSVRYDFALLTRTPPDVGITNYTDGNLTGPETWTPTWSPTSKAAQITQYDIVVLRWSLGGASCVAVWETFTNVTSGSTELGPFSPAYEYEVWVLARAADGSFGFDTDYFTITGEPIVSFDAAVVR